MKLAEALLSYANWNARRAWEQFQDGDLNKRLDAAASAGIATELLLKYLLARQSPGLLAELTTGDKRSALLARLTFSSENYTKDLADVRSCTAEDAFYIHKEIEEIPTVLALDEFKALMTVRNASCHLAAEAQRSQIAEAIYSLTTMYEKARTAIPGLEWPFTNLENFVEIFQYQHRQSSARLIKEKIKLHGDGVRSGAIVISDSGKPDDFLALWVAAIFDEDYSYGLPRRIPHKCVACKSPDGQLLCEVEPTTFYKPDDPVQEPTTWAQGEIWMPLAFACTRCALCLTPRELRTLELDKDGWAENATKPIPRPGNFEEIPEEFQVSQRA
ncbi:hypothetical protein HP499_15125 [Paenarthrobacter sp. CM16]|uniref:hypothetical protein n=1 Tax=Paenarthrobacter sp. CM16 TaxID=2738447 RepID=UPI001556145A|nr:hypothetical protein [Paenarthrobacter sp. CM16]NQD89118.1 hypothetical protein [Paenarthrobacter sp. CM16]